MRLISCSKNVSSYLACISILALSVCQPNHENNTSFEKTTWIHGSADCEENTDPPIQVVRYDASTWILRQNKCVHYEAPFMFLFLGEKKALLVDTGATSDESKFPLYSTVAKLISVWEHGNKTSLELVVAHSHNHGDHRAADPQFEGKPNTTVAGLTQKDVIGFFHLQNWPNETSLIELGNRAIEIIPIPGHEPASLAFYDPSSQLLLTGDTFYPGRLYVQDWMAFKQSIQRLADFVSHHEVSFILGNHIEMTNTPSKDYPVGVKYQPDEHALPLGIKDLQTLNDSLKNLGSSPVRKVCGHFIVYPVPQ